MNIIKNIFRYPIKGLSGQKINYVFLEKNQVLPGDREFAFARYHVEYDENPIHVDKIKEIMNNKKAIYDLKIDKRLNKIGEGGKLEKYPLDMLPKFLQDNKVKYKEWID